MKIESKRWIMLFACMLMNVCIGSAYAWSVFQKPLIEAFSWTAAEAVMAYTLIQAVSALPMGLAGKAQEYVQPKTVLLIGGLLYGIAYLSAGFISNLIGLYIAYGILGGLGQGIVYSTGVSNMLRFFPDKRGLCSGLLAAGMGASGLILAPIAAKFIIIYGVMNAFKIFGVTFLVIIVSLSFIIKAAPSDFIPDGWTPPANVTAANNTIEKSWNEMIKDPIFYVIFAIFITGTISGVMIIGR